MKIKFFIFIFIVVSVFQTSCSSLETSDTPANPEWETVEARYKSLESEGNFAEMETYSKELSAFEWANWQKNHIKFMLASALFKQNRNAEALEIFEELRQTQPFANRTHLMAGSAALAEKKYEESLKWVLSIYLKLTKEEKIPASKTVFFAYLYSKRFDTAAKWYKELDDAKKEASELRKKNAELMKKSGEENQTRDALKQELDQKQSGLDALKQELERKQSGLDEREKKLNLTSCSG